MWCLFECVINVSIISCILNLTTGNSWFDFQTVFMTINYKRLLSIFWSLERLMYVPSDAQWSFSRTFSVNSLNSVTKIFVIKRAQSYHLLCKRLGCYHSASKTHVRDRNFNMSPIHASVIYQIPHFTKIAEFSENSAPFRKNSSIFAHSPRDPVYLWKRILMRTCSGLEHFTLCSSHLSETNYLLWVCRTFFIIFYSFVTLYPT